MTLKQKKQFLTHFPVESRGIIAGMIHLPIDMVDHPVNKREATQRHPVRAKMWGGR